MITAEQQYRKMTETKIPKLISTLAIPTIISMLVTSIYNMADTYFVSQLDDTSATGAVGVVFSLMAIIQAIAFTIGMGSGTWISRLLGNKEDDKATEVGSTGFFTALAFGVLLAVFGRIFIRPLMRGLGSTDTILPYAVSYGSYILYAAPVMIAALVMNNILRGEGKAKLGMFGIATGGILNMVLDPIFIFDWGFGLKTAGAAIATGISQLVSFCILLSHFLRGRTQVRFRIRKLSKDVTVYLRIFRNGLPSCCRQGLASIATILLNTQAAAYAGEHTDAAIAAMGIVGKVFMVVFSAILGFGQGYQPVVGFNYGAKRFDRVKQSYIFTYLTMTAIMVILALVGYFAAPNILALFKKEDTDPMVLSIGTTAFRAQCLAMPFIPLGTVCNMTYQSIGKSWTATLLSACRQGFFYIPIILILPHFFGMIGVQITQAIADLCTALLCIPFGILFLRKTDRMQRDASAAAAPQATK